MARGGRDTGAKTLTVTPGAMRILAISTLFPNPVRPAFGNFVGNQMRAAAAIDDVDLTMISPIGMPPWPLCLKSPYRQLRTIPPTGQVAGIVAHYPRFLLIPRVGGDTNPSRIVKAVLPLVRKLHAQQPFDLVDASFFYPDGPAAARIAAELDLPLTIKSRGADIHYWGQRPAAIRQMLEAADQAAGLLAVSEALKTDMIALGMPGKKIVVHYTGLDRNRFHPIERSTARIALAAAVPALRDLGDAPLIVTPGALIARKGQAFAIEALSQLPGTHLALAGAGEDEASLRSLAASQSLSDRVHFLGQVSHDTLPLLLNSANAIVLPSQSEGLANAWVEALACGTPIVIPDIGGARELLTTPAAGRLVDREASAIAGAVRELLAAPPSQNRVAETVSQFSWEQNGARIAEFWRGIVASR